MKYTLTVSERQLRIIQSALEFYERPFMGQVDFAFEHPVWDMDRRGTQEARLAMNHALPQEKRHHGIFSPKISDTARIAYDLQQVIRYQLWLANGCRPTMTVNLRPPSQTSHEEPLASIDGMRD